MPLMRMNITIDFVLFLLGILAHLSHVLFLMAEIIIPWINLHGKGTSYAKGMHL